MTTRRKLFESAVDRAFLSGFALGHCLGMHEATKELRMEFQTEGNRPIAAALRAVG